MKYIISKKYLKIFAEGVRSVETMSIDDHIEEFCKELKSIKCIALKLTMCEVREPPFEDYFDDESDIPIIIFYDDLNEKLRKYIGKKFDLYLKER